ncbi:winged helix-turn-helix domain-containing protein [Shewanella psychropiezotolerans]|uniref:Winged helix-turn-helix domain-containing protein n=1 Tax=Shewanella psychropiezotolerans TaxID=2593655 RepID=A0ABX5WVS0_9GAMM|nr:helix-turn-helix domain-containing protein [Shewanella psychropiezotolerans]QDO83183.1 winged helix-turn-helix domain-containing protein [Shewanella psychropiezotolerans]
MNSDKNITYKIGQRYLFNVKTHQLTDQKDGTSVELGLNESRLLAVLICNNGEVVSREQILEEVWNQRGLVVDETSVNQTVSLLRKFLGDNVKEQKIIKTVTKMGYRLTAGVNIESVEVEKQSSSIMNRVNEKSIIYGLYIVLFTIFVSLYVFGE